MSDTRTFQDEDMLVWEVFSTAGPHGYPDDPHVIFHCLTDRSRRSRRVRLEGDEADAQRRIAEAEAADLRRMFQSAEEIP